MNHVHVRGRPTAPLPRSSSDCLPANCFLCLAFFQCIVCFRSSPHYQCQHLCQPRHNIDTQPRFSRPIRRVRFICCGEAINAWSHTGTVCKEACGSYNGSHQHRSMFGSLIRVDPMVDHEARAIALARRSKSTINKQTDRGGILEEELPPS